MPACTHYLADPDAPDRREGEGGEKEGRKTHCVFESRAADEGGV
jgi:hypothetical protein